MNKIPVDIAATQSGRVCTRPAVGDRLSAYLAGLLEGSAADEIEEHLRECRTCGEFYLTIFNMRQEARKVWAARAGGNGVSHGAKVLRLADFRKTRQ